MSSNHTKLIPLEKAAKICEDDEESTAMALSNLGSYYQKIGQYK
jgi:hypothetical protein